MFVFFCGFQRALGRRSQPGLAHGAARAARRRAGGIQHAARSLGLFAGGALGGLLAKWAGAGGLFAATALLTALWLVLTWPLRWDGTDRTLGHVWAFEYGRTNPQPRCYAAHRRPRARPFIRSSGPKHSPLPSGLLPKEFYGFREQVIIVGNLGRDPEMRTFPSGDQVANVTIATTDQLARQEHRREQRGHGWQRVVSAAAWPKSSASTCARARGSAWKAACARAIGQARPGVEKFTTEIRADTMQMLGSRQDMGGGGGYGAPR